MAIRALPQPTVRAIGASQVLNDPASVVKELIDNALDARSTSLAIEISSNTLDTIQLRDNGHGIPPEDRQLVARPHCTSKISGEDDLKSIGSIYLGFRGEALASMAEMSGSLAVSTRVEGEQVATTLKINQQGEVIGQERASLPIGTTVKITDFIRANPVRRQVALKNPEKCLQKIKRLLQCYAFARPRVRLSLRVLKAKNDKGNWLYAPKPGGNAEDVAFKVAGSACASQCIWGVVEESDLTLQAFLPRADADSNKIGNMGSFVSVDARPVSVARGIAKQLVKIYRESLKSTNADFNSTKEPFLYLEISCPTANYDANVEPAKDDVLFQDPDVVIAAARRLFSAVYPTREHTIPSSTEISESLQGPKERPALPEEDDFVTSLEPSGNILSSEPEAQAPLSLVTDDVVRALMRDASSGDDAVSTSARDLSFRSNMYGCDEEDLDLFDIRPLTSQTEADLDQLRQSKNVQISNPWVMAKMNASLRPRAMESDAAHDPSNTLPEGYIHTGMQGHNESPATRETHCLPTPRPSSPFAHPLRRSQMDHPPDAPHEGDGRMIGAPVLPAPQATFPLPSSIPTNLDNMFDTDERRRPLTYDYTLSSQSHELPAGTPLQAIPEIARSSRPRKQMHQSRLNKPFSSPLKYDTPQEKVWFDHLETQAPVPPRASRKRAYQQGGGYGLVTQGELSDLIEEPRPLTPPRRNRDMRDFMTQGDPAVDARVASIIESGSSPQRLTNNFSSLAATLPLDTHDAENVAPVETMQGSDSMHASELADMKACFGAALTDDTTRPTKRRRTAEARVLREVSSNLSAMLEEDAQGRSPKRQRNASHRRRSMGGAKFGRTKSSRLPLERVPAGQGTHRLIFQAALTTQDITSLTRKIQDGCNLLRFNETCDASYGAFNDVHIEDLASKLHGVLHGCFPEGEIEQDLGTLVEKAFAQHVHASTEGMVA